MGISILVESVVCPRSRYPAQTLYQRQGGWREVKTICNAFRWESVPWEDPSEQHGIRTSVNYSKYSLLLDIALSVDGGSQGHYRCFPHLLERDLQTTIYIPLDFTHPLRLKYPSDGKSTKTLTVGSALRLRDELDDLKQFLDEMVTEKGEDTKVGEYTNFAGHTWKSVYELCVIFRRAARESL